MSTIIAGRFNIQPQVHGAIDALRRAGFPEAEISSFYVNPAGQHDLYPIGGDHDKSPGAEDTDTGAVAGLAVGAAAGLAASPLVGPIGPLVGAYIGSLMGGLASTKEKAEMNAVTEMPSEHQSGMMVAVATHAPDERRRAVEVLSAAGGFQLETAEGHILGGDWIDFDPRNPPKLVQAA